MTAKQRPILFSGPMVRAILENRKTQTRRVIKPQPKDVIGEFGPVGIDGGGAWAFEGIDGWSYCPYGQPGDQLWVRETFYCYTGPQPNLNPKVRYRADDPVPDKDENPQEYSCWLTKPSIFMPRWVSRITLELTAVRVERLQDISGEDALVEGVDLSTELFPRVNQKSKARYHYCKLWDSINGKTHPWKSNPFVWVLTFKRIMKGEQP